MAHVSPGRWEGADLSISGRRAEIDALQQQVLAAMAGRGWEEQSQFAVRLVLEEALVNAHVHGNRRDEGKRIHVAWRVSDAEVRLEVEDEGAGFDPACVPDPTEEHNLEVPSGRGLVLMRAYMDEVSHSETGNRVVMVRRRGSLRGSTGGEPSA